MLYFFATNTDPFILRNRENNKIINIFVSYVHLQLCAAFPGCPNLLYLFFAFFTDVKIILLICFKIKVLVFFGSNLWFLPNYKHFGTLTLILAVIS